MSSIELELFDHISPISKFNGTTTITATTPQSNKKISSSQTKCDSSSSSLFRSTPARSSILKNSKSLDASTDNAMSNSSLNKRKSFHLNDDQSSESTETVDYSYDDEMSLSYGSQQHPQTPTSNKSKRHCNSVSRKNLSRSFNQIEAEVIRTETFIQIEENHLIEGEMHKTDSGFNEMNEYNEQQQQQQNDLTKTSQNHVFSSIGTFKHEICSENGCDVSMVSIN